MASKSPSKPWESNNVSSNYSSPIDSSATNNDVITPPTPIAKHTNNPHINRSGSSTSNTTTTATPISPDTNTNSTESSNTATNPLQQQPLQPYTGYNSMNSMYGNSMYGNGMYGGMGGMGGMYGNSMYGGMNGMGGMYGGGGMYGMQGPMGAMGFMQMSVNNVGRFSQLLQVASQALHMTFSSLVQFAGNIAMLAREFGGFLSGVYVFRFLKYLYLKIKKFLFWIIGKKPSTKEQFEEMFQSAVDSTNEAAQKTNNASANKSSSTHYSWLSIGFYCFGILYIIQWIWKSISNELNQQKKLQQQQQQNQQQQQMMQQQQLLNPMNPYQQSLLQQQQSPYGYIQPSYGGVNNMYPQQQMIQQQQQQNNNNNNSNNNNDNNKSQNDSNDDNNKEKKSESLLPTNVSG